MKQKKIYLFLIDIVDICQKKVKHAENSKLPSELIEYERGRLYEAEYILENVEKIIFKE